MKTLILAGGFGTRLREIVSDVPKPMAMIAGKPFLEHQINFLRNQGLGDIVLCVHYMADKIKSYFGDGFGLGVNITYSEEDTPLGTAGAIKLTEKYTDGTFLVLNGDSYSDVDFSEFSRFHKSIDKGLCSLVLTETKENSPYGNVLMQGDRVIGFSEKSQIQGDLINTGIYLFEPKIFDHIPPGRRVSLEREIFPELAREGKLFGQVHSGYFMDIGRPETYNQFRKDFLSKLQSHENINIRDAMRIINDNRTDLLLIIDKERKLLGVLNDNIIRRFLISGGQVEQKVSEAMVRDPKKIGRVSDEESKLYELVSGTRHLPILDDKGRVYDIKFHSEEVKGKDFPTVRGKSPLRISFGGGGTDLPYFFEEHGGVVMSSTIDKYCRVTAQKRADSKIVIESDMVDKEIVLDSRNLKYNDEFDVLKAIFNILKPGFGVDFHLRNDIPPGRGLGSSASFAVLVTKVLGELQGTEYDDQSLAEIAYGAEVEELGIRGGKQDQYAAVFGGFNWMEFERGDKKIIHPLRLKEDTIDELEDHLTLCYTSSSHDSGNQHERQEKYFQENKEELVRRLNVLKKIAIEIKENLLSAKPNFVRIGELLHESWQYKRRLVGDLSNSRVDRLYNVGIRNGAYGGKLLGSGGGGYILFFRPPIKRNQLERTLQEGGGEILDFNFETRGTRVWFVDR